MNLLFDLTAAQANPDGKVHGGGKYTEKVFLSLLHTDFPDGVRMKAIYDPSQELKPNLIEHAQLNHIPLLPIQSETLSEIIEIQQIDRLFTALPFSLLQRELDFVLKQKNCEVVGVIHGLRSLELPVNKDALAYTVSWKDKLKTTLKILLQSLLMKRDRKRYHSLLTHSQVITVSNHTQQAIRTFFPQIKQVPPVFYSPDVTDLAETETETMEWNDNNYFLLVNGNRWLKNGLRTAIALDELFSEHPDMTQKVVITGISHPEIYMRKLRNKERFILLSYVGEATLKALYRQAYAFIYLSLNEGFGYPPLEAMAQQIPVLASTMTSIPEVCGDAVLYADPLSISEIKIQILQLQNETIRRSLIEKGKQQYRRIKEKQTGDLQALIALILKK